MAKFTVEEVLRATYEAPSAAEAIGTHLTKGEAGDRTVVALSIEVTDRAVYDEYGDWVPVDADEVDADPLVNALSPDEASDLLTALSEVIDTWSKNRLTGGAERLEGEFDDQAQVERWQALAERIELAGDWDNAGL